MKNKKEQIRRLQINSKFLVATVTCMTMLIIMIAVGTSTSKKTYSTDTEVTCAAGKYLPANSSTCAVCPAGYYCPGDTYGTEVDYEQGKMKCPADYPNSETGIISINSCYEEGITIEAGNYYNNGTTVTCPKGSYCIGGKVKTLYRNIVTGPTLTSCGKGKTTSTTGAKSSSDCTACTNNAHVSSYTFYNCKIALCESGYMLKNGTAADGSEDSCVLDDHKVDKPSCQSATYNGAIHVLFPNSAGYTVTYDDKTDLPINAGTYKVKATLKDGYTWSDGSTGSYEQNCVIAKYTPQISIPESDAHDIEINNSRSLSTSVKTIKGCNGTLNLSKSNNIISLSNSSATIAVSSIETTIASSTITVTGVSRGESSVTSKFIPNDKTNCNESSPLVTGFNVIEENSYCEITTNMPEQVEPGKVFDVTATVNFKNGAAINSNNGYTWSCGGLGFSKSENRDTNKVKIYASEQEHGYSITCTITVITNKKATEQDSDDEYGTCRKTVTTNVGDPNYDAEKVKFTFKKGTSTLCTKEVVLGGTLEFPGVDDFSELKSYTKDGKTYQFNGWGGTSGCKTGTYAANTTINNVSTSTTYYACFDEIDEKASNDFKLSNCDFTQWIDVVYDQRYLNCDRSNIMYMTDDRAKNTRGNLKKCCIDSGYTWVGENYNSTIGGEYCIRCGGASCDNTGNGRYSTEDLAKNAGNDTSNCSKGLNRVEKVNGCYKYICNGSGGNPPSGSTEVIVNPPTGSALIYIVWAIGFAVIGYSIWYFTNKENS